MQMFVSSRTPASITAPCASAVYPFSVPPASRPRAAPPANQTPAPSSPCAPAARSHRRAAISTLPCSSPERLRQTHRLAVPRLEHLRRRHRHPFSNVYTPSMHVFPVTAPVVRRPSAELAAPLWLHPSHKRMRLLPRRTATITASENSLSTNRGE